ncbi:D-aminoacyl-tRNA deacylase 2-like [Sycon ciliatum]|uniref:D-aminoacyl-tRNA deacylase 2-like n=1 Tax=Sycon ciliatum TaxID=27933 RepID=UPI0020AEB553|eukprot:scpid85320/ scgid16201/ Probable D-tyrosyl-tRNA(Tyr) deacylase 2
MEDARSTSGCSDCGGAMASAEASPSILARAVVQQCVSARLQTNYNSVGADQERAEFVHIGRGMVVFVCFLKQASEAVAERLALSVLKARLCESADSGKKVSVLDCCGDVLIVPQATLGGVLKGKQFQYHKNSSPEQGSSLFEKFSNVVKQTMQSGKAERTGTVAVGTYGNRQVLCMETNGPSTHIIDL